MNWVGAALLVGVYLAVLLRQLTARGPPVWTIFVAGGGAMLLAEVLPLEGAELAVAANAPVLLFLLSLFLFSVDLERSGALDHLAAWILGRARHVRELPVVLFVGFGLLSAVLVNDALVLLGVPLLFAIARRLGCSPRPLLLTLAFSVSVGSVMTPFGNPQNLLVSLSSGMRAPSATFLRYLVVPTLVNLGVGGWLLGRWYGPELASSEGAFSEARKLRPPLFPTGGWGRRLREHPSLWLFPGTLLAIVTFDLAAELTGGVALPSFELLLAGAILLLLIAPSRSELLRRADWTILALFAGLFVVLAGVEQAGLIPGLEALLQIPRASGTPPSAVLAIALSASAGSQLFSNVPWVALQIPVLHGLGYGAGSAVAWLTLAGAATLAGNLTLLGAASNLIVVEQSRSRGLHLGLVEFVRRGAPLAGITLGILVVALILGI